MKNVPNRTFTVKFTDLDKVTTATLLSTVVNRAPQGGFTPQLMRDRNRLLEVTEKAKDGDVMKFEDADYKQACELVRAAAWPVNHKDLIAFAEQFGG